MLPDRPWYKSYHPKVPREVNIEETTLTEALTKTALLHPNTEALILMGKRITYKQLDGLVNRFAKALLDLGVGKGDKVALLLPNLPQTVIANYAIHRIGAVAVNNNPLYTERELAYQLNDSDAKVAIILDLLLPRIQGLQDKTKVGSIITSHISDYLPFPKKQLFPLVKKGMFRKIEPQKGVYQFLDLMDKYGD
ncbi:MAG: AMP-binding protein, partial [Smithellaceae bacterium]|nr:AMP-binding protein [Smithellaceae bacterium]